MVQLVFENLHSTGRNCLLTSLFQMESMPAGLDMEAICFEASSVLDSKHTENPQQAHTVNCRVVL